MWKSTLWHWNFRKNKYKNILNSHFWVMNDLPAIKDTYTVYTYTEVEI